MLNINHDVINHIAHFISPDCLIFLHIHAVDLALPDALGAVLEVLEDVVDLGESEAGLPLAHLGLEVAKDLLQVFISLFVYSVLLVQVQVLSGEHGH